MVEVVETWLSLCFVCSNHEAQYYYERKDDYLQACKDRHNPDTTSTPNTVEQAC